MKIKELFDIRKLSPFEKVLYVFFLMSFLVSTYVVLYKISMSKSSLTPRVGGVIKEGVLGSARFINPVLIDPVSAGADADVSALLYSGLLKVGDNGELVKDLAEDYTISENGKEYTFILKKGVKFHDGHELNANDVLFTINRIQDPRSKSPLQGLWQDVVVRVIDEYKLKFILPEASVDFLENLTVGILPEHLWSVVTPEAMQYSILNEHPVGSGPYKFKEMVKDENGLPQLYRFERYSDYHLGAPYIEYLEIKSYPNKNALLDALKEREINASADLNPEEFSALKTDLKILSMPQPRIFAVFFNPVHNKALSDKNLRLALVKSVDKEYITGKILHNYADVIDSPIPYPNAQKIAELLKLNDIRSEKSDEAKNDSEEKNVEYYLKHAGYEKKNENGLWVNKSGQTLSLFLSIPDVPELQKVAKALTDMWKQNGIDVKIRTYELGDFGKNVIRERNFDMILFGEAPGRMLDLYSFWHSTETEDPGLNLAYYKNKKVDELLKKSLKERNKMKRMKYIHDAAQIIKEDAPALFLYSPRFLYALPKNLKNIKEHMINMPYERFSNINKYFFESERIWNILK